MKNQIETPVINKQRTQLRLKKLLVVALGVGLGLVGLMWLTGKLWLEELNQARLLPVDNPESAISRLGPLLSDEIEPEPELAELVPSLAPIPESKVLPDGAHVFQSFNNCGPASLSMALSYFGLNVGQQTLGQALRPYQNPQGDNDDKSVTLEELAARAEEYGLVAYHRPAGDIELLQGLIALDLPVVTRTYLRPGEDIGHYRVVKGYDQVAGQLIQDDSLQGANLRYSYADFNQLWRAFNYEFLVLVPADKLAVVEQILGARTDERAAWQLALTGAEERLVAVPGDLDALFNRSVAFYHLGRYQEAIAAYEQVANRLPGRALWYQIEPILAYYEAGQFDRVLQITQQVFDSQNRAFAELHQLRGLIFEERGQVELAQQEFALARQYNTASYWQANL